MGCWRPLLPAPPPPRCVQTCTLVRVHARELALGHLRARALVLLCIRVALVQHACIVAPRARARLHDCTVQLRTHTRVCSRACTAALKPLRSCALAVSKPSCSCTLVPRYHRALTRSCRCTPLRSPSLARSGGALVGCTAAHPCHCPLAPPCTCTPTHACPRARRPGPVPPPPPPTPHLAHVRFGARRLLHAGACPPAVTWLAGRGLAPRYPVAVVTAWGRCAHARWVGRRFPPSLSSPPAPSTHPGSPRVSLRSLRLARYLQVYLRFSLALWACPSSPELPEAFLPPGSPQVSSPPACPSSPSDLSQVSPFPFILPKLFSSLIFPLPQPFVASLALLPHAKL